MKKQLKFSDQRSAVSGRLSNERGVALILTLGILVLVTMLVIAFAVTMRVENTASKNFNDLIKARQIAQAAVDQAVAVIRSGTPVITNAPAPRTYVTSPGAIFTNSNGVWGVVTTFTAAVSASPADSIDLNAGNLITGSNTVYLTTPHTEISAGWSNVVANGQLVGRFAYWVDDESTKVNLNVAGTRENDLEGLTPAAIDLRDLENLTPANQINITNYVALVRPLDTIESVKMTAPPLVGFAPGLTALQFSNNKFYTTVNSSSPDITPWGAKRLNLSNVVATAASPQAAVSVIAAALADGNLAPWFVQTFAGKYPSVQQIAANIVDFIDNDGTTTDSGAAIDLISPVYLGLEQTPYINEFQFSNHLDVVYTPTSAVVTVNSITQIELWYMYTNSLGWTAPAGAEVVFLGRPDLNVTPTNNLDFGPANWVPATGTFNTGSGNPVPNMGPPIFHVLGPLNEGPFTFTITGFPTTINFSGGVVTAILRSATSRIDYQLIPVNATNFTISALGLPAAGPRARNRNSEANDPRARPPDTTNPNYWNALNTGASGSLGANNSVNRQVVTTNTIAPLIGIRADADFTCHIISGSRDRGTMYPGELDFIHTGNPWRTFWLQPQWSTELGPPATIPDWAVLDLFSATDATNVIGRININAGIKNGTASFPSRLIPLSALLLTNVPAYSEAFAVGNIYTQNLVNSLNTLFPNLCPFAFTFIGEACEVQGLATNVVASGGQKALGETPVRGIANLITPRSNVFTIWAIAQSLRVPAGTTLTNVLGEAKVQAIVERYENPPGTVKFRTRYFRYIYE